MLSAGLSSLPSFSYEFLVYVWASMVVPVALYGFEVFPCTEKDVGSLIRYELQSWRRFLRISGRSPTDSVLCFIRARGLMSEMRVRRLKLFLKLVNAPVNSWQQAALVYHVSSRTPWFCLMEDEIKRDEVGHEV